jgi:lipopolysaccharide export system permease protein
MKILEKYILRENFKPFLVSLVVATFVMLLDRLIDLLNLIIEKHLDFVTIISIFSLSLPFMLALTVPMAVLLASIMSFGRLSTDNEIVAFKSCGINIYTLLKPTVIAAFILSLFMVYFNNEVLPDTNHQLKNLRLKVAYRRPATVIKPGVFNSMKNYTIYAKDRIDEELIGVLIYDRDKKKFPDTITAQKGRIYLSNGGNSLKAVLFNGQMHERDEKYPEKYRITNFKKFTLNLPDLGYKINEKKSDYRGDRELSSKDLKKKIEIKKKEINKINTELAKTINQLKQFSEEEKNTTEGKRKFKRLVNSKTIQNDKINNLKTNIRMFEVEIHKKYAIAFACLIFVLIGAPIGMMTRTSGVGMAFSVSSIVFLIYYGSLSLGEELADKGMMSPFLSMWISNIIFGVIGIYLVILSVKEAKALDLKRIKDNLIKRIKKEK